MGLQLIVSNPPKSTKRSKRGRKVRRRKSRIIRRNPGGVNMAKKSRRRRRRSGVGSFPLARRSSRKVSRRRGGRALGGFVSRDLLMTAGGAVAGFAGTNIALGYIPAGWRDSDAKRIAVKIGIALAGSLALRKVGMGALSKGLAVGGLVSAGIDAARIANVPGIAGLGEFGISAVPSFEFDALPSSNPIGINGLGCFLPNADPVF